MAIGLCASGAQAQAWHTELGFQGGFVRVKPAGTGLHDQTDLFFVPGFDLGPALPTPSTLFVIAPIGDRVALEPSFSGAVLGQGGSATIYQLGVRLDVAVASGLYAAGGPLVGRVSTAGFEAGLQLAAGYRFHLTGPIDARLEANVQTWKGKGGGAIPATDNYGLLFGIAARL